jgi:nitroreductase
LFCERFEQPGAWQREFKSLLHPERVWAHNAVLLIVACADLEDVHGSPNRRALYDTGAAALQLCLEATARGLATHTTTAFDESRLRNAFGIPTRCECVSVIAMGHPADLGTLGRDLYLRELAVRRRAPAPGRFFDGEWERPLVLGPAL